MTLEEILGNKELMAQLLNSDVVKAFIKSETDKVKSSKEIKLEEILGNRELMTQLLERDTIKALIQSETDRVRTKATQEKNMQLSEFAKYKQETEGRLAELTKFQTTI